jgi:hypothetical protein
LKRLALCILVVAGIALAAIKALPLVIIWYILHHAIY